MSSYEKLNETQQFACRVIADHARSTAFAIADGILPGNEGRNYVLRKIMRRAIYHGREHLGLKDAFFYKVCDFVVHIMTGADPSIYKQSDDYINLKKHEDDERNDLMYLDQPFSHGDDTGGAWKYEVFPELIAQREFIAKIVRLEEERFGNTLVVGLRQLNDVIVEASKTSVGMAHALLNPRQLAVIYDTYGLPVDLIYQKCVETGALLEYSEDDFPISEMDGDNFKDLIEAELRSLQTQSGVGHTERKSQVSPIYAEVFEKVDANTFRGYEATQIEDAKVVAILDGEKQIDALTENKQGSIVLDQTPFYAESGGQVGDVGKLNTSDSTANVADTYSPVAGLIIHKVTVEKGSIKIGDTIIATVNAEKRDATRRNHTATHLVHAALKEVLGTHVKQAGSVVAPSYLRFDFTHYQPMTDAEIGEVEDLVNRYILQNEPVTTDLMKLEDAMRSGAVAMFGEKYGGEVRVLSVGDGVFSKELCGGTHVRATGDIGSFKITADEAIASGVRRIRAITGFDAFERFREDEKLIDASLGALNTQRDNLPNAIARLQEELKRTRKEMDDLKLKIATGALGNGAAASNGDEARDVSGVKVMAKIVDGLDANGSRQLSDTLLARLKSGVVVLGRTDEGKVSIIVRVSDDLTGRVKAGNVIKEIAPIVGGRGGGKQDMAEGGGSEPDKLSEAINASYGVIERMLE